MKGKTTARIDVTNMCNLNCKYCYVHKEESKYLKIDTINDFLSKIRNADEIYTKYVQFFGGEPSLAHNIINEVIKQNSDFNYGIVSNGYRLFYCDDISFYKQFNNITFSLSGTERCYRELRGESGLIDRVNRIIELSESELCNINIAINISINGMLSEDIGEFIDICNTIMNSRVTLHFYSLKGENYFTDINHMIDLLSQLPENILSEILCLKDYERCNSKRLCSFGNQITLNVNGNVSACGMYKEFGPSSDFNNYSMLNDEISNNYYELWTGCKDCNVPVGVCAVSCPYFITEQYKNGDFSQLNKCCDFERVKQMMREMILGIKEEE